MSEKIVVDTSIIIDGKVPQLIEDKKPEELIVPYVVVDEIQAQASKGRDEGFIGLDELKKISEKCEQTGVRLRFVGERPSMEEIRLASGGRLDALIRDVAQKNNALLITADYVQALVGEAVGMKVEYIPEKIERKELSFKEHFTKDTMSIHLKQGASPYAKKGQPGKFDLVKTRKKPCTENELKTMIREIMDAVRREEHAFVEIDFKEAMVIQLGEYRIAIAKPPFSDKLELTVVRPLVKLRLEEYNFSSKLMNRLKKSAEGILIAGPPGSGKTTFASSLADYYSSLGRITKTLESPRDLQVGPEITQYAPLEGSFSKTAEILLLMRPDYTVFDEVRGSRDFKVFVDLRLAGVGMVGVVHSSNAINAIQRFLKRVELGMIPSVIDTVILIKYGKIEEVFDISLTVRVPTGMTEKDLTRPLVEIKDFETGDLKYEIYSFGDQIVVVPIKKRKKFTSIEKLAMKRIAQHLKKYDKNPQIELIGDNRAMVKINQKKIAQLIGKEGRNISKIEDELGLHIDVESK